MGSNTSSRHYTGFDRDFDARACYNFNPLQQVSVGHILKLSLISPKFCIELKADTQLIDPMKPGAFVHVVSVIDHIGWSGQQFDPMHISGRISAVNKEKLKVAFSSSDKILLQISWKIYSYCHFTKLYFESFAPITSFIETKISKHYICPINEQPCTIIKEPENYSFSLSLEGTGSRLFEKYRPSDDDDSDNTLFRTFGISVTE